MDGRSGNQQLGGKKLAQYSTYDIMRNSKSKRDRMENILPANLCSDGVTASGENFMGGDIENVKTL
jgi:hypothetical protein